MATTHKFWLPDDLKRFVDQKVRDGGYISGPEFLRDLIRQQRHRVHTAAWREPGRAGIGDPAKP